MATVYKAPEGFDPPQLMDFRVDGKGFDFPAYEAAEKEYIERLRVEAKRSNPSDKNAGLMYSTPMADSYAQYMVWRSRPLQLIHIDLGDGWHAPAPLIRGLRLKDIQWQAKAEAGLEAMFARSAK